MNRDEKRTRVKALRPTIVGFGERRVILPREPNGGTWVAANDRGVCIALINWHRIERDPVCSITSRGEVVMTLAGCASTEKIEIGLNALRLHHLRPFRFIAIVPSEKKLIECRWNLERLSTRKHPWQRQHWFSSGFNERRAELERRRVCRANEDEKSVGGLAWLRRLHQSHEPVRGPFSICMHRADAATVSYTEVVVSSRRVQMSYKSGSACSARPTVSKVLLRVVNV